MKSLVFFILLASLFLRPNANASSGYVQAHGEPLKGQLREWSVTFEADSVLVTNDKTKTNCKIDIDNVIGRFWLKDTVLVFESSDAVEDYLSFVDGFKCKFIKRVDLGIEEKTRKKRLKSLHLADR
jgi:hypothetical protein